MGKREGRSGEDRGAREWERRLGADLGAVS